jgi:hypothetical protein
MQKVILTIAILGLAVAVQAGETKTSNTKEKSSCCSEAKAEQAKASAGCCSSEKSACSMDKSAKQVVKQVLKSPKAAAEFAKK